MKNSDVVILLIDATRGFEAQDQKIFDLIQKNNKGLVIVVNKWDLIDKSKNSTQQFTEEISHKIAPFTDVEVLFVSATEKQRILKIMDEAMECLQKNEIQSVYRILKQVFIGNNFDYTATLCERKIC